MCGTCYIFSPFFLLHWFSQVVTKFTFTSETYVLLLLFKFLPSNAAKKVTCEKCGTQSRISLLWQHRRCATDSLHFTQCPNFSTTSQTYLSLLLYFSQKTVETWLHLYLTTVRWFWSIDHSWRLEIIALRVTSYKASFTQFQPELSTHYSSQLLLSDRTLQLWPVRSDRILLSSLVVQVGRVNMYKWNRLSGTG